MSKSETRKHKLALFVTKNSHGGGLPTEARKDLIESQVKIDDSTDTYAYFIKFIINNTNNFPDILLLKTLIMALV